MDSVCFEIAEGEQDAFLAALELRLAGAQDSSADPGLDGSKAALDVDGPKPSDPIDFVGLADIEGLLNGDIGSALGSIHGDGGLSIVESDSPQSSLGAQNVNSPAGAVSQERHDRAVYVDTFDWRLHRLGLALRFERTLRGPLKAKEPKRRLVCGDLGGRTQRVVAAERLPEFGRDFARDVRPEGLAVLGSDLIKRLGPRRLFPLVRVESRSKQWVVLNDHGKTVVRLTWCSREAIKESGRASDPVNMGAALTATPLRGYENQFERVLEALRGMDCWEVELDNFDRALAAVGLEPESYSSKFNLRLQPQDSALQAMLRIHSDLLQTLGTNDVGVLEDFDPEFLHDFRVAVRRARSALSQVRGVFPASVVEHFQAEFKWLGNITGPVRDLDVLLMGWDKSIASLDCDHRLALVPCLEFVKKRRKSELSKLRRNLRSERYAEFLEQWQEFLEGGSQALQVDGALPEHALTPIGELAGERIQRTYRKVWKRGRSINASTPTDAVHDLRIQAKKLRYLMEFFRSLYLEESDDCDGKSEKRAKAIPGKTIGGLIAGLKSMQDVLGDFNDYCVHAELLTDLAQDWVRSLKTSADSKLSLGQQVEGNLAMGALIHSLNQRREQQRPLFAKRWERFANKGLRRTFQRLFPAPKKAESEKQVNSPDGQAEASSSGINGSVAGNGSGSEEQASQAPSPAAPPASRNGTTGAPQEAEA